MYCVNCGSVIREDGSFCDACGSQIKTSGRYIEGKVTESPVANPKGQIGEQTQVWSSLISIGVVVILAFFIAYMTVNHISIVSYFRNLVNGLTYSNNSYEDSSQADGNIYYVGSGEYEIGGEYYVLTNLRVREGPGTDYRVLSRDELVSEDYINSVESEETADALIEEGRTVTCQEISGEWMRIPSGWVCICSDGQQFIE